MSRTNSADCKTAIIVTDPKTRSSLSLFVRYSDSLCTFKSRLKTLLFPWLFIHSLSHGFQLWTDISHTDLIIANGFGHEWLILLRMELIPLTCITLSPCGHSHHHHHQHHHHIHFLIPSVLKIRWHHQSSISRQFFSFKAFVASVIVIPAHSSIYIIYPSSVWPSLFIIATFTIIIVII